MASLLFSYTYCRYETLPFLVYIESTMVVILVFVFASLTIMVVDSFLYLLYSLTYQCLLDSYYLLKEPSFFSIEFGIGECSHAPMFVIPSSI